MKHRILTGLVSLIAVLLFGSCQLNPGSSAVASGDNAQPEVTNRIMLPSVQGLEEVWQGAYIAGSMIYSTNRFCNIIDGLNISIRLDKVEEFYDPVSKSKTGKPIESSVKNGYISIVRAGMEEVTFQYVLFNPDGSIFRDMRTITVKTNESVDLDGSGTKDLAYVPYANSGYPARKGFENAVLFMFLSSETECSRSLYYSRRQNYSNSSYPAGILNIKPEGRILINPEMSDALSFKASNTASFFREMIPDLMKGDYIVDQLGIGLMEILSVDYPDSDSIRVYGTNTSGTAAFNTMYFRMKGSVKELGSQFSPNGSRQMAPYNKRFLHHNLAFSIGFSYDLAEKSWDPPAYEASFKDLDAESPVEFKLAIESNSSLKDEFAELTNQSDGTLDFTISIEDDIYGDFYLDAGYNTGWVWIDGFVECKISLSNQLTVGLEGAINYEFNKERKIFEPRFDFLVGPVPVTLSFPLYIGVNFKASATVALKESIMIYGVLGARINYGASYKWFKINSHVNVTPLNQFIIKPGYPVIIGDISATLTPYLALRPTLTIAYVVGALLDARAYMKASVAGNMTLDTGEGVTFGIDLGLYAGLSLDAYLQFGIPDVWSKKFSLGNIWSKEWTLLKYTNSVNYKWTDDPENLGDTNPYIITNTNNLLKNPGGESGSPVNWNGKFYASSMNYASGGLINLSPMTGAWYFASTNLNGAISLKDQIVDLYSLGFNESMLNKPCVIKAGEWYKAAFSPSGTVYQLRIILMDGQYTTIANIATPNLRPASIETWQLSELVITNQVKGLRYIKFQSGGWNDQKYSGTNFGPLMDNAYLKVTNL